MAERGEGAARRRWNRLGERELALPGRAPVEKRDDATPDGVCAEPVILQPVRHTDARRLARSGASEDDFDPRGKRRGEGGNLVRGNSRRSLERMRDVVLPPAIDEESPCGDE
jgi:hypothetical protein